ncbi:hypothetical protein NDN01_08840 [Sphingomonas sp. QA11]|uniref:hypothetical protein n=1 Tax=Sphingomonas sp. QA11 TaxID=2950605 RepID=UPI00234BE08A|nr:hypothetical protein [Sphingomonas sp. QA11]WCM28982.1 hypothetical protein NDN01_08840 [Sphingomonas sp. QA11]
MHIENGIIGSVTLAFSVASFYLFFRNAISTKPEPADIAERVRELAPGLDLPAIIKAIADAFSNLRPSLSALLGSILFLLMSGAAVGVYKIAG